MKDNQGGHVTNLEGRLQQERLPGRDEASRSQSLNGQFSSLLQLAGTPPKVTKKILDC